MDYSKQNKDTLIAYAHHNRTRKPRKTTDAKNRDSVPPTNAMVIPSLGGFKVMIKTTVTKEKLNNNILTKRREKQI